MFIIIIIGIYMYYKKINTIPEPWPNIPYDYFNADHFHKIIDKNNVYKCIYTYTQLCKCIHANK